MSVSNCAIWCTKTQAPHSQEENTLPMAALTQPVSDIFHMISEDFKSSQYLNDMKKQQNRPKVKKQKLQTGIFQGWLCPKNLKGYREGSKEAPGKVIDSTSTLLKGIFRIPGGLRIQWEAGCGMIFWVCPLMQQILVKPECAGRCSTAVSKVDQISALTLGWQIVNKYTIKWVKCINKYHYFK